MSWLERYLLAIAMMVLPLATAIGVFVLITWFMERGVR